MSKNSIKYKKSKILQVGRFWKGGYFGLGGNQFLLDNKKWEILVKIAFEWRNPHTKEEILQIIKSKNKKLSIKEIKESISFIKNNNFLVNNEIDFNLNDRYSRNHLFYNLYGANHLLVQKKLLSKHVTIIGCGGIGNHISYLLTTSGIGKITLVDNDNIEISNLNRQFLFTE